MAKNKQVKIGSEITVRFKDGYRGIYKIVNSNEADITVNKISVDSPLGKAVIDRETQENITFFDPNGKKISCQVLKIYPCENKGISD